MCWIHTPQSVSILDGSLEYRKGSVRVPPDEIDEPPSLLIWGAVFQDSIFIKEVGTHAVNDGWVTRICKVIDKVTRKNRFKSSFGMQVFIFARRLAIVNVRHLCTT